MSKNTLELLIKDIIKDPDVYPRRNESPKTIEAYAEALEAGARFPPILVQRISTNDGEEYTVFLDGLHRARASERIKRKSIEAEYWKKETLNKEEWLTRLQLESAKRNAAHGDRLGSEDKKYQARKICEKNPDITEQEIADAFGVSQKTVSNWVSDIKLMQKAECQAIIYRLNSLGWTQEEIAKVVGLARSTVAEKMSDLPELLKLTKSLLDRGDPIERVADKLKIDLTLAWAMVLDGKVDLERFKQFGKGEYQNVNERIYNVWNFTGRDPRLGLEVPGNIPGQIAMNALYYYTKQGDLVVDPMAGGGSTVDACLVMGRRCRAYDLNPPKERDEIVKHDIRGGFLKEAQGCDMIFLDPPYWRLQKGGYSKESISEYSYEDWLDFMKKLASDCFHTVKKGGYVALVIEAFLDEKVTGMFLDLPFICLKFFLDTGFTQIQRITAPMPSEIKSVQDVEYAKKKTIMLDLNRDLIIFRKT
jgi:transcriptional regulator with XRE-family HTH domain